MKKYPYLFFGSAPIGPIALDILKQVKYPPKAVIDNPKLSPEDQLEIIAEVKPTFILVVGYGAILRRPILDAVAGQVLNIHPSYLPAYRGPAPVVWAILEGAKETGVTLIKIDEKMDHGPILAQEKYPLIGNERPSELYSILIRQGTALFLEHIEAYLEGDDDLLLPQIESEASFSHFVKKDDGLLDLKETPEIIERKIRAYQGWPRTWVIYHEKRLLIDRAHLHQGELAIDLVQLEGNRQMSFKEFCLGQRLQPEIMQKKLFNLDT